MVLNYASLDDRPDLVLIEGWFGKNPKWESLRPEVWREPPSEQLEIIVSEPTREVRHVLEILGPGSGLDAGYRDAHENMKTNKNYSLQGIFLFAQHGLSRTVSCLICQPTDFG